MLYSSYIFCFQTVERKDELLEFQVMNRFTIMVLYVCDGLWSWCIRVKKLINCCLN